MRAKATLINGRIMLRTQASGSEFEEAVARCKAVPGARWRKADRAWSYPASVDVCKRLRAVWGDGLVVLAPLADWYREAAQRTEAHARLSAATDADLQRLPTVAPRLAATLRPDQRVGAVWVANAYRGAGLVADKPGLGKTLETLAGLLEADVRGPVLIVCPKLSVKPVWFKEITRWTDEAVYMARGTRQQRQKAIDEFMEDDSERKFLIIVAEMLRVERKKPDEGETKSAAHKRGRVLGYSFPDLFRVKWSTVLVDESHRLFGSLTVAKGSLAGEGLAKLPLADNGLRIACTATPFGKGGRVQGMFGTLHWLWPDEFTSYWRWVDQHFETEEAYIGKGKTAKKIVGLRPGLSEEEFLASLGPRILRRTKEEVLPNLPPKQYVEVTCELTPAQVRQYKSLSLDGEIVTPGGIVSTAGVLSEITRAKQLANGEVAVDDEGRVRFTGDSGKIDMLMQKLEERGITTGDGDTKVLVASQFNEFLSAVMARLDEAKVKYHLLVGSTSDKERDRIMEEFQADGGPRVFLLNSKAGGVSITLDSADEVHCLDELWNPEDNEQLEDRAHRASRIHQVTIYYYRSEGTVDQAIAEDVENKRFQQFNVLDGRRGLEYTRNLISYRRPEDNS